jgi:hypothetical protein
VLDREKKLGLTDELRSAEAVENGEAPDLFLERIQPVGDSRRTLVALHADISAPFFTLSMYKRKSRRGEDGGKRRGENDGNEIRV